MTFWYLPRPVNTIYLVVYEPHRVLEDLKVSDFKVKIASQKWPQTSPKLIVALYKMKK